MPLIADGDTALEYVYIVSSGFNSASFDGCSNLILADVSTTPIASLNVDGCTSLVTLYAGTCGELAALDLTGPAGSLFDLDLSNTPLTSVTALDACAGLTSLNLSSTLVTIDPSDHPLLENYSQPSVGMTTIDISTNSALLSLDLTDNALDEAAVDGVLVALDGFGLEDGEVDLSGGTNAPPSATGLTAKANLEGKGWGVTVN